MVTDRQIYLGCDPGISGCLATLNADGLPEFCRLDETPADVHAWLWSTFAEIEPRPIAVLERVASSPQMGVRSAFTFGQSYGALEAFLVSVGCRIERVSPAVWQKALGCRSKGDKNVTKRRAQELFPGVKVTHRNADALLLAEYGRRTYR